MFKVKVKNTRQKVDNSCYTFNNCIGQTNVSLSIVIKQKVEKGLKYALSQ